MYDPSHIRCQMCLPLLCRFFTFILLLFLVHSMGIAMFRCLGALARNEVIASTGGSFFFLILLLVGGFLLAKQNIPDWWIWAYWSVQQPCACLACHFCTLLCCRGSLSPNLKSASLHMVGVSWSFDVAKAGNSMFVGSVWCLHKGGDSQSSSHVLQAT